MNQPAEPQSAKRPVSALTGLLDLPWYPVGPPWGNGTFIRAGQEDCGGLFVVDCESMLEPADGGIAGVDAADLASYIAKLHNDRLGV